MFRNAVQLIPVLEGRGAELAQLGALIDRAREGHGGTFWLVGDPGVGKTSLLDALVRGLPDDVRVVRLIGRESESGLAWGALAELLAPLVEAGHADGLPVAQRTAVRTALALEVPVGALEPYAVLTATQAMLQRVAEDRTVVVVVDDAQWLDESSRLAVAFLAARVRDGRLAFVVAERPLPAWGSPDPSVVLAPLDAETAGTLLARKGVTAAAVRHRLLEEMGGNPLLLLAAAGALDGDQRAGRQALPEVLPVPASVMRLADERLQAMPEATRRGLLVAATGGGAVDIVMGALTAMGMAITDLEPAERAGLVVIADGEVRFGHPTLRSTAYHAAAAGDRRAAHRAVAAASADPTVQAWHRGQGALGVDDEVADALEASSRSLRQRGASLEAAHHLELAARLTAHDGPSARRLREAAELLCEHGRDEGAEALLDRADRCGGDAVEGVRRERLRLRIALRVGAVDDPIDRLRALADAVADDDPGLSAAILLDVLAPLVRMVRAADLRAVAETARARAEQAGDERLARRADVATGIAAVASGDADGYPRMNRYREVLEDEGAVEAGEFLAEVVAPCLAYLQRSDERRDLFDRLENDLRGASAIPVLVSVLGAQAIAVGGSSSTQAAAIADEAVDLAEAIGRPSLALLARSCLAMVTAGIGDRERCRAAYEPLIASSELSVRQTGLAAEAFLHVGHGELDEAIAVYERLAADVGIGQFILRWEADWCEALLRARRPDEARQVLEDGVAGNQGLLSGGTFARVRGLLADDLGDAEEQLASAVSWYQFVGNRVGEGRTELAWGERLRRARRRGAARDHLERALDLLDGAGATVWADRARYELDAAGSGRSTAVQGVDALTSRELAIARHAAAGASNREIGEQVFLSPRTVETHLGAVYRKLGVTNRRQLAALALEEPRLRP